MDFSEKRSISLEERAQYQRDKHLEISALVLDPEISTEEIKFLKGLQFRHVVYSTSYRTMFDQNTVGDAPRKELLRSIFPEYYVSDEDQQLDTLINKP